jgi:hypothetical protein
MKTAILLALVFILGCSPQKSLTTNNDILQAYSRPFTIYDIGGWNSEYVILNLVDAKQVYFNVRVPRNNNLVIGAIYLK